jgi:DNA-binding NtrC family response regulator
MIDEARRRYRIFVVDDDETLADMTGQMLRLMGYSTMVCSKPLDALALFSETPERFDAVIVDEMMPDLTGTQLAMQLLRVKDDIPIILMTGYGDMIPVDRVRKSGVRATLIKPVQKEKLEEVLEGVLKSSKTGVSER